MFTPGFKLFGGLSALGVIGALVYGLSSGGVDGATYFGFVDREAVVGLLSLGWKGDVGNGLGFFVLIFMGLSAALLGGTAVAFRDADVESVAELGPNRSAMPLAQRPTAPSWWPAASAVGVGVLLIGLVLDTKVFWWIGLIVMAVVALEWALTAWADRSTGDATANEAVRDRVLAPFEMPVLALAGGAVMALSISRIFVWATGNAAVLVAGVLALIVLAVAILAAFAPQIGRRTVAGIVGVVFLAIVGLGIFTATLEARGGHHSDEQGEEHNAESTVEGE